MAKKISKKSLGYLIPTLLLIGGAFFLYYKTNVASGGFASGGFKSYGYFTGGKPASDLDVHTVRWHQHQGYERVVFDIYKYNGIFSDTPFIKADKTGHYQIGSEMQNSLELDGEVSGYRAFSAAFPSFAHSHMVKSIEVFPEDDGNYLFTMHLKRPVRYKVFSLKNPARIIIDLR